MRSLPVLPFSLVFLSTPSARRATTNKAFNKAVLEFLSTPSARRATKGVCVVDALLEISIHALREEGDDGQQLVQVVRVDFYPRPPRGGRQDHPGLFSRGVDISIHALREEGDPVLRVRLPLGRHFYPRPPRGGRPRTTKQPLQPSNFYPRPPRGGRLRTQTDRQRRRRISIHALREEGDSCGRVTRWMLLNFYPRPPRGGRQLRITAEESCLIISIHALREEGDPIFILEETAMSKFLSTPSARRATTIMPTYVEAYVISIHALREEGDQVQVPQTAGPRDFYPRPPRGGRRRRRPNGAPKSNFYPRPPRGGRLVPLDVQPVHLLFLSTPSARRATPLQAGPVPSPDGISIHALREEGDAQSCFAASSCSNFYPRPPRGGRLNLSEYVDESWQFLSTPSARRATGVRFCIKVAFVISIHALREEGDPPCCWAYSSTSSFLSTPSARRATAKTETKSLFSNKLYNILHEFRRALIYNGSKSYPNHAK